VPLLGGVRNDVTPAMATALKLGIGYLPLANAALGTLETWIEVYILFGFFLT
jgi:hypothetical protein